MVIGIVKANGVALADSFVEKNIGIIPDTSKNIGRFSVYINFGNVPVVETNFYGLRDFHFMGQLNTLKLRQEQLKISESYVYLRASTSYQQRQCL